MKKRFDELFPDSKGGRKISLNIHDDEIKKHQNKWKILGTGAVLGLIFTLLCAGAYHYMGTSSFCMTCHSMEGVGSQWKLSRHKQFACIDCHLPTGNPLKRVLYKAHSGLNDLFHETTGNYPVFIRLSEKARLIASSNCLRCHFSTVEKTPMIERDQDCIRCHRRLIHGKGLMTIKGGLENE